MSTYYHFYIIPAFDELKAQPLDEYGSYRYHTHPSSEKVSIPEIEPTIPNYLAAVKVGRLMVSGLLNESQTHLYKTFFGNMFWTPDEKFKNDSTTYYSNDWQTPQEDYMITISNESLKKVVALENDIEYGIFGRIPQDPMFHDVAFDFRSVTNHWLSFYKLAISKAAGVVIHVG